MNFKKLIPRNLKTNYKNVLVTLSPFKIALFRVNHAQHNGYSLILNINTWPI